MKKTKLSLLALASLVVAGLPAEVESCTNILVTRGASADGSTMLTYAADSHELYGELYYWQGGIFPAGARREIYEWDTGKYLGTIPQARLTYTVVGNMNEHQLAIAETTFGGRSELMDPDAVIDYGSLIYIALQRAKTAREAIHVMTELVAEHGYYSSGESFSLADPNEVWILEMISKGTKEKGAVWVARMIPDGYISGHANQARVTTFPFQSQNKWDDPKAETFNSPDVISFARTMGYFDGADKDFSFSDTYAPLDFGAMRFCEARVWSAFRRVNAQMDQYQDYAMGTNPQNRMPLWIKPDSKLSVDQVMQLMRDHYQGTPMDMTQDLGAGPYACPYRWRPLTWESQGKTYFHERAISTQQTAFSFVTQSRSWLPDPVGGLLWFGLDDTYSTVYMPIYCGIREVPPALEVGNGDFETFSWESAFWTFNFVTNYAYGRYSDMIQDIQRQQQRLEGGFLARQASVEAAAKQMHAQSPEAARAYLTDYSLQQVATVMADWKKLGEFLIVKYLDGNVRDESGTPGHPPYAKKWNDAVAKDTGDKLLYPQEP